MKFYAIPNHSSSLAFEIVPWEYSPSIPMDVKSDKAVFSKWCQKPTTEHCFFSAFEGTDAFRRVSREDNPVYNLHGLVVDYDANISLDALAELEQNCHPDFPPMAASRTFSDGARLIWRFEAPVTITNDKLLKKFLSLLASQLKLKRLLPGWDKDAFFDEYKYYEVGHTWGWVNENAVVPTNMIHHWLYKAGNSIRWDSGGDISIPLDVVEAEVHKRFPGRWSGVFEDGARGVMFWDEFAKNTSSAVVRATGMQCFAGDKPWMSWKEIFGTTFVQQFEAERTGQIVADVYYDGKYYWKMDAKGFWTPMNKEDFRLMLKVKYELSSRPGRAENSSEVDKVIYAVHEQKSVAAAMPFVHMPSGTIQRDGFRYLNTSVVRPMEPATAADGVEYQWGDGFPWMAKFLNGFFDPAEQLDYFLAWFKHFYANALIESPRSGQAIFIAGDTGLGKTLMSSLILSKAVGGHVDASSYLLGEEKFTSHVVGSPIMAVDDTAPATDQRRHTRYSAMIKKITANRHQHYEEKFHKAGQVTWLGRVVVTCNLDPESIRLLPNIELSLLDKISLFRCRSRQFEFPDDQELEKTVVQELPCFLRWLLAWEPPEHTKGSARFGVASYHEDKLHDAALQTGPSYTFLELLSEFLQMTENEYWEGTSTQLVASMSVDEGLRPLINKYNTNQVACFLGKLKSNGVPLEKVRVDNRRVWRIPRNIIERMDEYVEAS